MPLIQRNPKRAFEDFEEHIEGVVKAVLPIPHPVRLSVRWAEDKHKGKLEFTKGSIGTSVPVDTKVGTLYLSLNQDLLAVKEGKRKFRLRTTRYSYRLAVGPEGRARAILRWDFRDDLEPDKWCRQHVHVDAAVNLGETALGLERLHVPTAWVLIEHVLRFLFTDLNVKARTHDWPEILRASEKDFVEKFSGRHYRDYG
jgi:hypothetical protein